MYIDWESGAVDVAGCSDPVDRRCRREIEGATGGGGESNRGAQLFLTRVTTTIYATDVYSRESIVSVNMIHIIYDMYRFKQLFVLFLFPSSISLIPNIVLYPSCMHTRSLVRWVVLCSLQGGSAYAIPSMHTRTGA